MAPRKEERKAIAVYKGVETPRFKLPFLLQLPWITPGLIMLPLFLVAANSCRYFSFSLPLILVVTSLYCHLYSHRRSFQVNRKRVYIAKETPSHDKLGTQSNSASADKAGGFLKALMQSCYLRLACLLELMVRSVGWRLARQRGYWRCGIDFEEVYSE